LFHRPAPKFPWNVLPAPLPLLPIHNHTRCQDVRDIKCIFCPQLSIIVSHSLIRQMLKYAVIIPKVHCMLHT
jgi:hypothetical protein